MTLQSTLVRGSLAAVCMLSLCCSPNDPPDSTDPLPVLFRLPSFSLTERSGKTITLDDFSGVVWVADFIFTTCSGPCPELGMRMASLSSGLERFGGQAKTVSFSVDPAHDRPAVLRRYADKFQADPDGWWFLTSDDEAVMHELVTAGFLQALAPSKGGSPIIHSTRFVLVDQTGRVRALYDGMEATSKFAIIRDVQRLLKERNATE